MFTHYEHFSFQLSVHSQLLWAPQEHFSWNVIDFLTCARKPQCPFPSTVIFTSTLLVYTLLLRQKWKMAGVNWCQFSVEERSENSWQIPSALSAPWFTGFKFKGLCYTRYWGLGSNNPLSYLSAIIPSWSDDKSPLLAQAQENQSREEALIEGGTSQVNTIVKSHHIWLLFHVSQPTVHMTDLYWWLHYCITHFCFLFIKREIIKYALSCILGAFRFLSIRRMTL